MLASIPGISKVQHFVDDFRQAIPLPQKGKETVRKYTGPLPIGYALAIYQVFCVFKNAVVICLCANPPLITVTDAMAPEIRGDLQ